MSLLGLDHGTGQVDCEQLHHVLGVTAEDFNVLEDLNLPSLERVCNSENGLPQRMAAPSP